MIVGSLLLILVAVTLLVLGLASGSSLLLISSIAASLLAAIALVVGARQALAARLGMDHASDRPRKPPGQPRPTVPSQRGRGNDEPDLHAGESMPVGRVDVLDEPGATGEAGDGEDPLDEPAAQSVSATDAARVARMVTEVLVVDGRPRYHLAGCGHLRERESEPLPVGEAVELGFSPCGLCSPDSVLLADAPRR